MFKSPKEPRLTTKVAMRARDMPGVGDDVAVQLRGPTFDGEAVRRVLIKQLVRSRQGAVVLRQFNPVGEFPVPTGQVSAVYRAMARDEAMGC